MISATKAELDASEMAWAGPHLDAATRPYFHLPAGVEHYRLLAHLSERMRGRLVLDVGTFHGASALALSSCPQTRVVSFDLVNHRTLPMERDNLEFRLADVLDSPEMIVEAGLIQLYGRTDICC